MNAEQMTLAFLVGCGIALVAFAGFVVLATPAGIESNSRENPLTEDRYCESHPGFKGCITTLFTESIAFISGVSREVECCPENYSCSDTLYLNCSNG